MKNKCMFCNVQSKTRDQVKFCSNKCQNAYYRMDFLKKWRNGLIGGTVGISARTISEHVRRYLLDKFDNRCSICGWNEINKYTGSVPVEIDHIDGDAENSSENNLRLLCPNCHSLTPHFRNLNKGKGRKWRMRKYIKNG